MRTNAWITIERDRAITWRDWCRWLFSDQSTAEPPLTAWEKKAVCRLADMEYIFRAFLRPTILTKVWIMLSVYDVTPQEIASGYTQLGDAEAGGDFACAGYWQWLDGQSFCQFTDLGYPWRPAQVTSFMPPTVDESGQPVAATGPRDVNLLLGQPPREFPA
jgi:hypothetical protein